jgi:hypothetical protein
VTEQELRALVREAIARHAPAREASIAPVQHRIGPTREAQFAPTGASFALFVLSSGADEDGPCLIEPAVMCNHCGYCKSYGH